MSDDEHIVVKTDFGEMANSANVLLNVALKCREVHTVCEALTEEEAIILFLLDTVATRDSEEKTAPVVGMMLIYDAVRAIQVSESFQEVEEAFLRKSREVVGRIPVAHFRDIANNPDARDDIRRAMQLIDELRASVARGDAIK